MNSDMGQINFGSETSEPNISLCCSINTWPKASILKHSRWLSRGMARYEGAPYVWGKTMQNIQSSLAFRRFVLLGLANSEGPPKDNNVSLRSCNGSEHQNCSTARRGLQDILHDVQGLERWGGGEGGRSSHHSVSAKKINTIKGTKRFKFCTFSVQLYYAYKVNTNTLHNQQTKNTVQQVGAEFIN
jgi:hypothetical protein